MYFHRQILHIMLASEPIQVCVVAHLQNVKVPTNESVMILKANIARGCSSDDILAIVSSWCVWFEKIKSMRNLFFKLET